MGGGKGEGRVEGTYAFVGEGFRGGNARVEFALVGHVGVGVLAGRHCGVWCMVYGVLMFVYSIVWCILVVYSGDVL